MEFGRQLRTVLSTGLAWAAPPGSKLRELLEGLAKLAEDFVEHMGEIYDDLLPSRTRQLEKWEQQFGLLGSGTEDNRRLAYAAAWKEYGGQSPRYLQDVVQAAGFDLYIHDWWESGPPYIARDPRDHTEQPLVGEVQCGEPLAECGEPTALANAFLANEPGYIVNLDLTPKAPPPVPSDPEFWPFFTYWGGETFGDAATVDAARRAELERLLLKLCPSHHWLVVNVDYSNIGDALLTEAGDILTTEAGVPLEWEA
jgi:hypothetical protein